MRRSAAQCTGQHIASVAAGAITMTTLSRVLPFDNIMQVGQPGPPAQEVVLAAQLHAAATQRIHRPVGEVAAAGRRRCRSADRQIGRRLMGPAGHTRAAGSGACRGWHGAP